MNLEETIKEFDKNRKMFDPEWVGGERARADKKRFQELFPPEKIRTLTLDEYVSGKHNPDTDEVNRNTFCNFLESQLDSLGNIWGSGTGKFGIYFGDKENDYVHKKFSNPSNALQAVKDDILFIIEKSQEFDKSCDWEEFSKNIDKRTFVIYKHVVSKLIAVYGPENCPIIHANDKIDKILDYLNIPRKHLKDKVILKKFELVKKKESHQIMKNWDHYDYSHFLLNIPESKNAHSESREYSIKNDHSESREYSIKNIIDDGCFVSESELESIMAVLKRKKNLILQGPPGTGKTWLAKKLAFALMGTKNKDRIERIQFHPNISYEDFVRGYRPDGEGKLKLVDGPFLVLAEKARNDPDNRYVCVIEEINRGNPANIFGEMLTLLEADKRNPEEALTLSYTQDSSKPYYIPDNLYVIGTMNVADRSIALVDLALRRRFGFCYLKPIFDKIWKDWVHKQCGIDLEILNEIGKRLESLNEIIEKDELLGPHFKVGHSYVTPREGNIDDPKEWFRRVVEHDIGPLLDEYLIGGSENIKDARDKLLKDW